MNPYFPAFWQLDEHFIYTCVYLYRFIFLYVRMQAFVHKILHGELSGVYHWTRLLIVH